jgi:hypothetical protein
VTGRSVKTPRVRATHGTDPSVPGTTAWLLANDPWLAYARGRELFLREFAAADGVFGEPGRLAGKTLDDGTTRLMSRDHASSCAMCHNVPFGDGGAGATIGKNSGFGRNTPHVFGSGLLEMIGQEVRLRLLGLADLDRDGQVTPEEAEGRRAVLAEGGQEIDYGSFADEDGDGRPDLNPVLRVWYLAKDGRRLPSARSLRDPGVTGYSFEAQVLGHGQRDLLGHGAVSSTLRAFSANAFDVHAGLVPCDATLSDEPAGDGLARTSLVGAPQFASGVVRDRGLVRDARGRSLDDPDRDGVIEEITAGDLDLIELYQLNHPRPAERPSPGRDDFLAIGCGTCHLPDWRLEPRRAGDAYTDVRLGERRFFDLETEVSEGGGLRGRLVRTTAGAAVEVQGVYSDLLHHDVGPAFHEVQYDGSVIRRFRTAPLWGVGSTAPYGHDGQSLDLDAVIRRHGGEAEPVTAAYLALDPAARDRLLAFLRGLVLYDTQQLPCDVDGDGQVAPDFEVAGQGTGAERLNPEWLFRIPARIEGWVVNLSGERVFSNAVLNLREAYALDLSGWSDRNRDRWPDDP